MPNALLTVLIVLAILAAACVLALIGFSISDALKAKKQRVGAYSSEPNDVSDLVPWAWLIAPGVVLNRNGMMQTTFAYRGPDVDSATPEELVSLSARLNNVIRRLGDGWTLLNDMHRSPTTEYPSGQMFPDPVSYLIDEERRAEFEAGIHFESTYYVTLGWLPPRSGEFALRAWMFTNPEGSQTNEQKNKTMVSEWLDTFNNERDRFLLSLSALMPEARALSDDDMLTYLHDTISTSRHPVKAGQPTQELNYQLCDTPLIGGKAPQLGQYYIGALSLRQFPIATSPGLLDRLNRLDMAFRWTTRWIALNKIDADKEIKTVRREWFAGRKSFGTVIRELMTKEESMLENTDAVNNAADADAAMQELAADAVSYGYFTQTIIVLDRDSRRLEQKLSILQREIDGLGFVTVNETRDGNALDAFLGAVPGNAQHNLRRPMVSSLNLAHIMPSSAVWAGPLVCPNDLFPPNSAVHLYTVTNGSTPFRLSTFVGDVGHTLMVGPTGAGKSVALNVLEAQWLRYKNAQVYIFDKGGSSRILTAGVGGRFYDLGTSNSPAFQPLANIEDDHERAWAHEWLIEILANEGLDMTPERKGAIWTALVSLATSRTHEKTLSGFSVLVQDMDVKLAIAPFTVDGPHGHLLDAAHDDIELGNWLTFEMEELMNTKRAVMPVLSYLFHKLEQRFDGSPTLLVLDEAWLFLDNPAFAEKIREWLKVLRKANVAVIFATQSLADVAQSSIVPTIIEACKTKIYLPNAEAKNQGIRETYRKFGLNDKQLTILTTAMPKSDYYLTSESGNRLFSFALGPVALAYCAATGKDAQKEVLAILDKTHYDTSAFNRDYLSLLAKRGKNVEWASDFLMSIDSKQPAAA
jgi:type IV secretion system protein TrbE